MLYTTNYFFLNYINGKLLKIRDSMYNKAKCRVKWKAKVGDSIDSKFGVLQSGMLSPELFKIFLSDLLNICQKKLV